MTVDTMLEDIYQHYGYDFRGYARASIERRIKLFLADSDYPSVLKVMPKLLNDGEFFAKFVSYLSVSVTEFFRDPEVYRVVREQVVPLLKTWSHIKIWHAGCATGEEVYSLAIVLKEEGLYDRTTIYATDISEDAITKAQQGIYNMATMRDDTLKYQRTGGKTSFSDYYHARYDAVAMSAALKERMVFSTHNLASDSSFGEIHLIFCRNVMIYFNQELKNRALGLFTESLVHGGFLCLGSKEDIRFSNVSHRYQVLADKEKIYRKLGVL
ncbi:protein-glutamate O-methyltransferase CheR [Colwellia sp. C1TZA3]|nr:protein-glutamate O-methyltransferase CheR [Colwellia sp. C1TZA3]